MTQRELINFLQLIGKLKVNTRHCWTTEDRQESVAEHSWRLAMMAMLCKDEYPELDIDKVIKMCLIHDLGEAVTGDIPAFVKTQEDEQNEENALLQLLSALPEDMQKEFIALFSEMNERKTPEAKLFKSLDNLEALISHNEADISTWLPNEYELNLVYGKENCEWSEWTRKLREQIKQDSIDKISKH